MKMIVGAVAAPFVLTASNVFAQSRSSYDWQSGDIYTVTPGISGGAHVNGFNLNTGSMRDTDVDSRGEMHGFDDERDPARPLFGKDQARMKY